MIHDGDDYDGLAGGWWLPRFCFLFFSSFLAKSFRGFLAVKGSPPNFGTWFFTLIIRAQPYWKQPGLGGQRSGIPSKR